MEKQDKFDEDILNQYINSDQIEKAPDGFTSKIMTRIQIERVTNKIPGKSFVGSVPFVSSLVTIALIIASALLTGNDNPQTASVLNKYFNDLHFSLPSVDFKNIFRISLPTWLPWVFVGILILTIFDKALFSIFSKDK